MLLMQPSTRNITIKFLLKAAFKYRIMIIKVIFDLIYHTKNDLSQRFTKSITVALETMKSTAKIIFKQMRDYTMKITLNDYNTKENTNSNVSTAPSTNNNLIMVANYKLWIEFPMYHKVYG